MVALLPSKGNFSLWKNLGNIDEYYIINILHYIIHNLLLPALMVQQVSLVCWGGILYRLPHPLCFMGDIFYEDFFLIYISFNNLNQPLIIPFLFARSAQIKTSMFKYVSCSLTILVADHLLIMQLPCWNQFDTNSCLVCLYHAEKCILLGIQYKLKAAFAVKNNFIIVLLLVHADQL